MNQSPGNKKETFILRTEWSEAIQLLNDKEQAAMLRNLFEYHKGNFDKIELSTITLQVVWNLIEPTLKRNIEHYDRRCETSALNGKKGGRPPKNEKPKKPILKPMQPIESLYDSDSDSDSGSDNNLKNRGGDIPLAERVENAEAFLLQNLGHFRRIVSDTRRQEPLAKESLRKYHLHLEEKSLYPLSIKQALAGFEKWLRNESRGPQGGGIPPTPITNNPNYKTQRERDEQKARDLEKTN